MADDTNTGVAADWQAQIRAIVPGLLLAVVIAMASQFVSEHYGAPAMLLALLFGIAMNFLSEDARSAPGIAFGARTVLRAGVALLGLRISFDMVASLGWPTVALVVLMVPLTIGFGLAITHLFGFRYRFAVLSAGAVAICGASAAMAIAAVLPKDDKSEDRLVFTVVGVTVLSTLAMILYPILSNALDFDDVTAGIYLGATIHDVAQVVGAGFSISEAAGETATLVKLLRVAQVVGAGFSISEEAGETATLVKLLRVAMLAPVVVITALILRGRSDVTDADGSRPPLVPGFVLGFVALATLNSTVDLPRVVQVFAQEGAGWLLLTAIAAVGLKTKPAEILKVGRPAAAMIVTQTVFLAVVVALALTLLPIAP